MTFTLAIIGRPNVGKSTLFNRLTGKQLALVHDTPGLTRDWREADAHLMGLDFKVIDTAGLEENFDDSIQGRMRQQTERALERADMALLVYDSRIGVTAMDRYFADWLRRQNIKAALVANKCESYRGMDNLHEAYELGMGEPIPVSAEHGDGMEDLFQLLRPHVFAADPEQAAPEPSEEDEEFNRAMTKYKEGDEMGFGDEEAEEEDLAKPIRITIAGRPNVGKSTLLNALVGEHRSMTGPEAGITRDAVHVEWEFGGRQLHLVDTAGLRRRARIDDTIEKMSVEDTLRAIRLSQVVMMVIDAETLFEKQDLTIAGHIFDEGRAMVLVVNKWDLITDKEARLEELKYQLSRSFPQARDIPIVTTSALEGRRLKALMDAVLSAYDVWNTRVSTGKLNRWLRGMEEQNPAPLVEGRQNRLRYMTQIKARPPTFALWVSRPDDYPESHQRYLINGLRRTFNIPGTPIRFVVKTSKNPYAD